MTPLDGRLPDRAALSKALLRAGQQFSIRGMEATVEGWLEQRDGIPVLRVEGWDEPLSLAPLTNKVQWSRSRNRRAEPTAAEQTAHARLLAEWDGLPRRVVVTGPVRVPAPLPKDAPIAAEPGAPRTPGAGARALTVLEVRLYALPMAPPAPLPARP